MAIPFFKELRIGGYLIKQKMLGRKRYPLVLMLEPLFRCNLACVGCGKIDYLRLEALGGSLSGQAQARSSQVRTNPDRLGRRDVFDSV